MEGGATRRRSVVPQMATSDADAASDSCCARASAWMRSASRASHAERSSSCLLKMRCLSSSHSCRALSKSSCSCCSALAWRASVLLCSSWCAWYSWSRWVRSPASCFSRRSSASRSASMAVLSWVTAASRSLSSRCSRIASRWCVMTSAWLAASSFSICCSLLFRLEAVAPSASWACSRLRWLVSACAAMSSSSWTVLTRSDSVSAISFSFSIPHTVSARRSCSICLCCSVAKSIRCLICLCNPSMSLSISSRFACHLVCSADRVASSLSTIVDLFLSSPCRRPISWSLSCFSRPALKRAF
mmetsp:Transcript_21821/g.59774  ORF Transcript_21821/g.59774 Transcript_21821/m.59774 type:complete len:301 (+) Transcript_21821:80-982(+)